MLCALNLMLYISYISVRLVGVEVLILTQLALSSFLHIPTPPSVGSNTYTVQEMDEVEDRNRVACPASPCFPFLLGKEHTKFMFMGSLRQLPNSKPVINRDL